MNKAILLALLGLASGVEVESTVPLADENTDPSDGQAEEENGLSQLMSTAFAGAKPGVISEPIHRRTDKEMQKQTTKGRTKNYRFHWQYACAFTKWIPSNQFLNSGKDYNAKTMTLERFGFIGMDKKCFWGMIGVDWITPLKITQIKPGKGEKPHKPKPKPPAEKPKPKPPKKRTGYNFDGKIVKKCPANAIKFEKSNPKSTHVNFDTSKECHKWKNFVVGDFKLVGFKWANANAYSGGMYVRKGGKWYLMDNDEKGNVNGNTNDSWHRVAHAFCKAMKLPWKKALQQPKGRPSWAFKVKSNKHYGFNKCPSLK